MDFNLTVMIAGFAAIFITINPISKVPFFLVLTEGYTREQKKKVMNGDHRSHTLQVRHHILEAVDNVECLFF